MINFFQNADAFLNSNVSRDGMVFTNGCFDLLHAGHVRYLNASRDLGKYLIIGLNSDASVKRLKGPSRPVNNERDRAEVLLGLSSVDYVVLFDEDTPCGLIKALKPSILTKGGDYEKSGIVGADFVEKNNGRVVVIPFEQGYSTTGMLKRMGKEGIRQKGG